MSKVYREGSYEISKNKIKTQWGFKVVDGLMIGIAGLISFGVSILTMNQLGIPLGKDLGSWIILVTGITVLTTMMFSVYKNMSIYNKFKKILRDEDKACWEAFQKAYENYCKNEVQATQNAPGEYIEVDHKTFVEQFMSQSMYRGRMVLNHLRQMKSAPSLLIVLGVLGTFIGLVIGLKEINIDTLINTMSTSEIVDTNNQEVFNSLLGMIGGIHTAFLTSIMGIISSIIVQLVMGRWNCEEVLTHLMLKFEMKLDLRKKDYSTQITVDELRKININLEYVQQGLLALENLKEATIGLNICSDKMKGLIDGLNTSLSDHDKVSVFMAQSLLKISGQFEGLNERLQSSEKTTHNLMLNMGKMEEAIHKVVEVQEEFGKNIDRQLQQAFEYQLKGFEKSLENIFENYYIKTNESMISLKGVLNIFSQQIVGLPKHFEQINTAVIKTLETKENHTEQQMKLIEEKLEEMLASQKIFKDYQQNMEQEWHKLMANQKDYMSKNIEEMQHIAEKLPQVLEETNREVMKYMESRLHQIGDKIKYNTHQFDEEIKKTFENTLKFMELANKILKRKYEDFEQIQRSLM